MLFKAGSLLIGLAVLMSCAWAALPINCTWTNIPKSGRTGVAVTARLVNNLGTGIDVCWFDFNGFEKKITYIPNNMENTIKTWNSHAFTLRKNVPYMPCKGPQLGGPFKFYQTGGFWVGSFNGVCTVPSHRRILRGWSDPANFKGVQGEIVTWDNVIAAKNKPIGAWKRFYNRNGNTRLFKNIPETTELWEVKVANSKGLDTTRLICSWKGNRATFRGVISHTPGLGNFFKIAETLPAAEVAAAVGTGAAADAAVAEAVGNAVVATGDAVAVGETVSSIGAAFAAAGEIAVEVAEVVGAIAMLL